MKLLIAPDSFKECLTAREVAAHIAEGWRRGLPGSEIVLCPMADGGEGTLDAILSARGGKRTSVDVTGPMGEPVRAQYGLAGNSGVAVVEMASATGIHLVPLAHRKPLVSTTFGVGELLRHAMEHGAKDIIVGVGGSATNDGGAGMAQALGWRLLDADGKDLPPGGAALASLHRIEDTKASALWRECRVRVACDVTNPLCGDKGATAVYGPQKGVQPDDVSMLDDALRHFADVVEGALGVSLADCPRAGAAGGLAGGLKAFLGAELCDGAALVAEMTGLEEKIGAADLVITGEGRMDAQTLNGKVPFGVARIARAHGVPVIGIAGVLGDGWEALLGAGFTSIEGLTEIDEVDETTFMKTPEKLQAWAETTARKWQTGTRIS